MFIALFCGFRANPGCLGSLGSFKNRFSEPIEQGQKHSATKRALAEGRKAAQALAKILCRWFLRRTKALISDQLPKKDDRVSLSVQLRFLAYFQMSVPFENMQRQQLKLKLDLTLVCAQKLKRPSCMYMLICSAFMYIKC